MNPSNPLVTKFCNRIMKSGKKSKAYLLFSQSFTLFLQATKVQKAKIFPLNNIYYVEKSKLVGKEESILMGNGLQGSTNLKNPTEKRSYALLRTEVEPTKDKKNHTPELAFLGQGAATSDKVSVLNSRQIAVSHMKGSDAPALSPSAIVLNSSEVKAHSTGMHGLGPLENLLHQIVENVRPCIELRKVRIARVTHQVPSQISKTKGQTLAIRWIVEFANKKKEKDKTSFAVALSQELQAAYKKSGGPRQRRNELHKLGEANRSSVRYRWW